MGTKDEIEITAEMVCAGVGVCPALASPLSPAAEAVSEIYRAMEEARLASLASGSRSRSTGRRGAKVAAVDPGAS